MALICRGFVPVQMTKKSVKPAALRRSSTTRSIAFLSSAARTAPATLLGNLGGAFFFVALSLCVATLLDPLVFAMQAAYRSIQTVFDDVPRDRRRHEIVNRLRRGQPLADLRRRDVARRRVHQKNARRTALE